MLFSWALGSYTLDWWAKIHHDQHPPKIRRWLKNLQDSTSESGTSADFGLPKTGKGQWPSQFFGCLNMLEIMSRGAYCRLPTLGVINFLTISCGLSMCLGTYCSDLQCCWPPLHVCVYIYIYHVINTHSQQFVATTWQGDQHGRSSLDWIVHQETIPWYWYYIRQCLCVYIHIYI